MKFRFLPREEKFFEMFAKAADNMEKGILALRDAVTEYDEVQKHASQVKQFEHEGDDITHDLVTMLNKTFLTPLDREDIHQLACTMDDIIDMGWGVADRFVL